MLSKIVEVVRIKIMIATNNLFIEKIDLLTDCVDYL